MPQTQIRKRAKKREGSRTKENYARTWENHAKGKNDEKLVEVVRNFDFFGG